jgi:transcriptional regulator with XRE-family HTH domain
MFQRYAGANVRKLRERRRLTQEQLAELAGIEARYVRLIERGRMNVTLAVLVAVGDALGVEPARLFRPADLLPARPGRPRNKTSRTGSRPRA